MTELYRTGRPYRPNPAPRTRVPRDRVKRRATHVKQETLTERRERKREEAEERQAAYRASK